MLNYSEAMRYVFDSYDKNKETINLLCSEYEAFARIQKEFDKYKICFYNASSKEMLRQAKADLAALLIIIMQRTG
jgi:hypothetical protein